MHCQYCNVKCNQYFDKESVVCNNLSKLFDVFSNNNLQMIFKQFINQKVQCLTKIPTKTSFLIYGGKSNDVVCDLIRFAYSMFVYNRIPQMETLQHKPI